MIEPELFFTHAPEAAEQVRCSADEEVVVPWSPLPCPTVPFASIDGAVTGTDIAESISKSLAKKAIAVKVDGEVRDAFMPIEE